MLQELTALGMSQANQAGGRGGMDLLAEEHGGIELPGNHEIIQKINLFSRTATRVLVRLGGFHTTSFEELRKKASRMAWDQFLTRDTPILLKARCRKSKLYHSDAVAERVAAAVGDALGGRMKICTPLEAENLPQTQRIFIRLVLDECTLSIDSSGELLHRRGYRLESAKAPLRETLAAGMILASGWDQTSPLMDPFCGAGTIPIEAGCMASGIAPGSRRAFAFMFWPGFNRQRWERRISSISDLSTSPPLILGSDRDAGAVKISLANAERAGMTRRIGFSCLPFSAIQFPPEAGWLVTNPPYGHRVSAGKDLRDLYARLGNVMRERGRGWRFAVLCPDAALFGHSRLPVERTISLVNGGIQTTLFCGQVG